MRGGRLQIADCRRQKAECILALCLIGLLAHASAVQFLPFVPPVGERELELARRLEAVYSARPSEPGPLRPDPQSPAPDCISGQLLIAYQPGCEFQARELVAEQGGRVLRRSRTGADFVVAEFPGRRENGNTAQSGVAVFHGNPAVRYCEPVVRCHACYTPNDSLYSRYQWDHWTIYSDRAWDITTGIRDVKVCVVDQGADYNHPDLKNSFDPNLKGFNFVDGTPDPRPAADSEFHATHVSGIIAAGLNNSFGIAGWANVTLYSCRVLDVSGSGTMDNVAEGIRWGADHGCRIVNLSLGGDGGTPLLEDAVDYAWNRGCLIIGASGNDYRSGVYYPAAYPNAIAVGALDTNGFRASFSNFGPELDLIAPGVNIVSTMPNRRYGWASGTSMATPEVSGVAALLLSCKPSLTNSAARAILEASAIDMGVAGKDNYHGYGLIHAQRCLQLAALYDGSGELVFALEHEPRQALIARAGQTLSLPGFGPLRVYDAQGRVVRELDGRSRALPFDFGTGIYFLAGARQLKLTVLP